MSMKKAKRRSPRRKGKLKLKKNTVYNLFSVGLFVVSALLLLSFTQNGSSAVVLNDMLVSRFGGNAFLAALLPLFFAFYLLHLKKFFLSQPNVAFGYLVFFISFIGLLESGGVGSRMSQMLSEMLTSTGADLVFIAGAIIGTIVFFDTSMNEIFDFLGTMKDNLHRLFPTNLFHRTPKDEKAFDRNKPLMIKGGAKDLANSLKENKVYL